MNTDQIAEQHLLEGFIIVTDQTVKLVFDLYEVS